MSALERNFQSQKIKTDGKYLDEEMRSRLLQAIMKHKGFLIVIAKEQAWKHNIPVEFCDKKPIGWFADLVSAGIYGMCRGALAWQEKKIEGYRTTNFDGELKQAARVRVKHLAKKLAKGGIL